jgi:hypothetical protein
MESQIRGKLPEELQSTPSATKTSGCGSGNQRPGIAKSPLLPAMLSGRIVQTPNVLGNVQDKSISNTTQNETYHTVRSCTAGSLKSEVFHYLIS